VNTIEVKTPDGVTLAVHEWGNPGGPEILFIHGVAQSHLSFERQFNSELTKDHRIVAFDLRGHGASDKPLEASRYHEAKLWADEVQSVIEAKRLRKPILVGWSLGGRVIGQYLRVHGDKYIGGINFVAARVIADPAFSAPGMKNLPAAKPRDLGSQIEATAAFLRACFHKPPTDKEFATQLAFNLMTPPEVPAAIRSWPPHIPETQAALRAVTVPTLVTHGRMDAVVLPAAAEATLSLVPGSQASWYDDCGHAPFFEDAPRFNRELSAFVARVWKE
jgi:non-heme chloroperoxidase